MSINLQNYRSRMEALSNVAASNFEGFDPQTVKNEAQAVVSFLKSNDFLNTVASNNRNINLFQSLSTRFADKQFVNLTAVEETLNSENTALETTSDEANEIIATAKEVIAAADKAIGNNRCKSFGKLLLKTTVLVGVAVLGNMAASYGYNIRG